MYKQTHQVNSGVQLKNEFLGSLLAILDSGDGPGVRPLPELGGEGTQADIVARLLLVKASHSSCLQLCHEGGET